MRTTSTACAPTLESARTPVQHGLTEAEAARRLAARSPVPTESSSRSYASIVRANVFTVFNLILLVVGVFTLAFGDWQDALFLGILFANAAIGIAQEVRAKRALDRLAALVAPTATRRSRRRARAVAVDEVVVGDLVLIEAGRPGRRRRTPRAARRSRSTSRSSPASRTPGDARAPASEVRSGSFAVEGGGAFVVTAVGPRQLRRAASPARRASSGTRARRSSARSTGCSSSSSRSSCRSGSRSAARSGSAIPRFSEAVPTAVAAVVTLVPEGLILLDEPHVRRRGCCGWRAAARSRSS